MAVTYSMTDYLNLTTPDDDPCISRSDEIKKNFWDWETTCRLIFAVLGISGNGIVVAVYLKKHLIRNSASYFIVCLAAADLISSVAMIPIPRKDYVENTTMGNLYCKVIFSSLLLWVSVFASVLLLTVLTVDRYVAVIHPTKYKYIFKLTRLKYIVLAVCLFSFVFYTYSIYITDVIDCKCQIKWPNEVFRIFIGVCLFMLQYFLPVCIMVVVNLKIIYNLKNQADNLMRRNTSSRNPGVSLMRARRKMIRMVIIVVVIFIICWTPDQVLHFAYILDLVEEEYLYSATYQGFVLMAYANSCANPIIYMFVNEQLRNGVKGCLPYKLRQLLNIETDSFHGSSVNCKKTDKEPGYETVC
ncbi:kappa-type opioid receptor-like [Antedon mediterranea]|uniref:kappa-type opioid receptor-like n=1 Tax=Antedon mediterranea TaxID=105859 RepID=UPI003AF74F3E